MTGQHDGVAGDAGRGADDRGRQNDLAEVMKGVAMRIDAGEGTDDGAFADGNPTAVVEQSALTDGDSLIDREVVAEGQVHAMIDLDPRADAGEDVPAQHRADPQPEPVIGPDRRAVEHLPEPQ